MVQTTDAGATLVLVPLAASHDELWARISKRNEFHADDPTSRLGQTKQHIVYAGDSADVIAAIEAAHP
ncbi:hypothetical protein ACFWMJ_20170 [Streptomyces hawaiiensis]|uniref:hypothetical protein n=1 Tax=Streptomyces hawaiiensis TaxID=67305 RepID=UPI003666F472